MRENLHSNAYAAYYFDLQLKFFLIKTLLLLHLFASLGETLSGDARVPIRVTCVFFHKITLGILKTVKFEEFDANIIVVH